MLIENPDLLKQWLQGFLAPLCDADPEALAKYCLALVRKDRPVSELKASMVEQLDVFLQTNTKSFVDKFLQVAIARSYMPKRSAPSSSSTSSATAGSTNSTTNAEASSDTPSVPPLPPTPSKPPSGHSPDSTTPPNNVPPSVTTTQAPSSSSIAPTATPASTTAHPTPPLPPPPTAVTTVQPPPPPPETAPPPPPPLSVIVRKEEVTSSQRPRKESERDRDDRRGRRRSSSRGRSRSRSRSGSRGRDRSRRSRSRGRSGRSSKYDDRRRRSPLSKRYRRSRTRSRTRSPRRSRSRERKSRSRNRSRSISPRGRTSTRGVRSPPRSPTPPPRKAKSIPRDEKRESPHGSSPVAESKIEGRSDNPGLIPSMVAVKHPEYPLPPTTKKQRCRDYDEKGYCMRGDMCSFDHGSDPVVLEGISAVLDFPPPPVPPGAPPGYTPAPAPPQGVPRPRHPPPRQQYGEYTPREPSMWVSQPGPSQGLYYGGGPDRGPGGMGGPRFSAPPPPLPTSSARELISVPVNNGNHIGGGGVRPSLAKRLGPAVPLSNSLPIGMKIGRPDQDSSTLELRKIPPGLNTIAHLNDHFSKFGTVVNIQVHHEGSPESALVTFSGHSEANAAYRSTEAVLNNRFIKVFWHNPQNKGERGNSAYLVPHSQPNRPLHERLGARHPNKTFNKMENTEDKSEKVLMSHGSLVKTVYNTSVLQSAAAATVTTNSYTSGVGMSARAVTPTSPIAASPTLSATAPEFTPHSNPPIDSKKQEIETIRKQQELLAAEVAAKQKAEKQKADAMKLKSEVEQRKKQLLDKQMQQLKVLVAKLEDNKGTMKSEEKKKLLGTIRSLQTAIDSTRSQLVSAETASAVNAPKTKAQLDRDILDTELELYNVQAEGGDTTKLRLRLGQLRSQQQAYGYPPTRSLRHSPYVSSRGGLYGSVRGRGGRGALRGRGRGAANRGYGHSFASVDRRTTKINASGFEREDKDEVLAHFATLGKVTNYNWDGQTPAVTIQYATRREAEKAMTEGRTLGDRLLTLTWAFDASPPPQLPISQQPAVVSKVMSQPQQHITTPSYVTATPHSTTPLLSPDDAMEEITEEIVEEVETEDGDQHVLYEDEEEEVEEDEEEVRSWRR
ncbi:hypothetical protein Pcinc_029538 [Petrolisthes cinctipes]|uniref:RNA-binding protein 26 n=1 Tax=Petrolisthes cinctipes TaxID=88211 RepID=A0AAE1F0T2_PETCI|nr:hypothetical protein Pcinc_029538 [Petrolisthes cinctipes]